MKNIILGTTLIIGLINLNSLAQDNDFMLQAITAATTAGKTFILLTWPDEETAAGFNLYRKDNAGGVYPNNPINNKPITVLTDCNEIKTVINPQSTEWITLVDIFTKKGTIHMPDGHEVPVSQTFAPCNVAFITRKDTMNYQKLQALAHIYWKIARVIGQACVDNDVVVGNTYWYEIRSVDKNGNEIQVLDTDVQVAAGNIVKVPPPIISAEAGDSKVLILWEDVKIIGAPGAVGYDIERIISGTMQSIKINMFKTVTQITKNLKGDTLIPPQNGFVDFQRWDKVTGNPISHEVNGNVIDGPQNGITYEYRVRGRDIFDRPGNWSAWVLATPQDKTPPAIPASVEVQVYQDTLQIRWLKVTRDAENHPESSGIFGYSVYRYTSPDSATGKGTLIGSLVPQPTDSNISFVSHKDGASLLRPLYGEKSYWYRVQCVDKAGNKSHESAAAEGHLSDTHPPAPPKGLIAVGFSDHIELTWEKNNEPDTAGYMIYRGICGGESIITPVDTTRFPSAGGKIFKPYPLHPIANIDNADSTRYLDYNISKTSPICYRYAVKAYDKSQNLSDTSKTICQRIREEEPPPPPVISGLKARNNAIRVEWVAPPVQDLFGFIVERSETGNEPWIQVNPQLNFPVVFGCEDIPAINVWAADSIFSFTDATVTAKKIYWYRVKGADYGGHISEPSATIETYTFDFTGPPKPEIVSITQVSEKCALRVTWNPVYDASQFGFVVFRSSDNGNSYRQMSSIITGNDFIDDKIVAGKTYWYKVQYFRKDGNRSFVSNPKSGKAVL